MGFVPHGNTVWRGKSHVLSTVFALFLTLSIPCCFLHSQPLLYIFGRSFFGVSFAARWRRAAQASWKPLWPLGQSAGTHGREAAV